MALVVRPFQQACKAALAGCIDARAFAQAPQRASGNPTRAGLIGATWKLRRLGLGDLGMQASAPGRGAPRCVEPTRIGRDGRFIR